MALQTWEECLLISLSNIRYTLKVVLPRVEENLKSQGYPDLSTAIGYNSDWTQLETLDTAVLEAYLERRCDPLIGTIEPSMYLGDRDWTSEFKPKHVKPYVQEILANVIAVHAEVIHSNRKNLIYLELDFKICIIFQVRRVSPRLLYRVLSHIVETISEELARLMSCANKRFSAQGIIQARTDMLLLQKALERYCTKRAK